MRSLPAPFALAPLEASDFAGPSVHRFTVRIAQDPAKVWDEVNGARPLRWCRALLNITWTSPAPHGVGTTRQALISNGLLIRERFILWEETPSRRVNAFTVVAANLPLFRRFGERYTVVPTDDGGSEFTWELVAESRLPQAVQPIAARLLERTVRGLERDTRRHFGC